MQVPPIHPSVQNSYDKAALEIKKIGLFIIDLSSDALGYAVAALAMKIFFPAFSWPLAGIGLGLIAAKLVIKVLSPYNHELLMDLTYEACELRERYPKLQTISFIFAMGISLLSNKAGLVLGLAQGVYGAIILDVENYKIMQKASRHTLLEKGFY